MMSNENMSFKESRRTQTAKEDDLFMDVTRFYRNNKSAINALPSNQHTIHDLKETFRRLGKERRSFIQRQNYETEKVLQHCSSYLPKRYEYYYRILLGKEGRCRFGGKEKNEFLHIEQKYYKNHKEYDIYEILKKKTVNKERNILSAPPLTKSNKKKKTSESSPLYSSSQNHFNDINQLNVKENDKRRIFRELLKNQALILMTSMKKNDGMFHQQHTSKRSMDGEKHHLLKTYEVIAREWKSIARENLEAKHEINGEYNEKAIDNNNNNNNNNNEEGNNGVEIEIDDSEEDKLSANNDDNDIGISIAHKYLQLEIDHMNDAKRRSTRRSDNLQDMRYLQMMNEMHSPKKFIKGMDIYTQMMTTATLPQVQRKQFTTFHQKHRLLYEKPNEYRRKLLNQTFGDRTGKLKV
ncbi:hypothetical protein SNEBB_001829 [Seison nebaliae]|nr:hypothetical protein SNEBB_001829 [Seison nebaliae]